MRRAILPRRSLNRFVVAGIAISCLIPLRAQAICLDGRCTSYDFGLPVTITNSTSAPSLTVMGGNVGFGTVAPLSPLTVAGVIESTSGGIKFPDGSVQATAASGGIGAILPGGISIGDSFGSGATGIENVGIGLANTMKNLTSGRRNIAIGPQTLNSLATGGVNLAIGYGAISSSAPDVSGNVAVGAHALKYIEGSNNVAVGGGAGQRTTTGLVTVVGSGAGSLNTTGEVTAIGSQAGGNNTTGNVTAVGSFAAVLSETGKVTSVGYYAASRNTAGQITAVGYEAAIEADSSGITAVGHRAAASTTTGYSNTVVGSEALSNNTTGNENTIFGYMAANSLVTGSRNVVLGAAAPYATGAASNNIVIGYYADIPSSGASNTMGIGNAIFATGLSTSAHTIGTPLIGIANSAPAYTLDVAGDINSSTQLRIDGTSVCTVSGCTSSSDMRLKKDIRPIEKSFEQVLKLKGVNYFWKDSAKYGDRKQIGLIAQEVEKVFPEVVVTDSKNGLKSIAYDHLVVPLIESVKFLAEENEQLRLENAEIKGRLERIEKALQLAR